jgi:hypothetical protein
MSDRDVDRHSSRKEDEAKQGKNIPGNQTPNTPNKNESERE